MTAAERQVHPIHWGSRLTRIGAELVRSGCTEEEALRILDCWFDSNVQDPCCATEAMDYFLEGSS